MIGSDRGEYHVETLLKALSGNLFHDRHITAEVVQGLQDVHLFQKAVKIESVSYIIRFNLQQILVAVYCAVPLDPAHSCRSVHLL
jgi:hypothetical protein